MKDLKSILEFEDDSGFCELLCPDTGVLVWPAIRIALLRYILSDLLYAQGPGLVRHRSSHRNIVAAGARSIAHNALHPAAPSAVLIVASGAGLLPQNGRMFNRYTDYFASVTGPSSWTMEGLSQDKWPWTGRSNPRIGFLGGYVLRSVVAGRLAVRDSHRRLARAIVELAETRTREVLGWDLGIGRRKELQRLAARRIAAYPAQAKWWSRLLRRVRPTAVMAEEASYGHMAVANAVAREAGVLVAEFQHGMVTRGHDAYNVGATLATCPAYRRTQPSTFLSYGSWWNQQFNAPIGERVPIGYPHRQESLRQRHPTTRRSNVLVLGDGYDTGAYINLCQQLSILEPSLRVVFRPHPSERANTTALHAAAVSVDSGPDLYAALTQARVVVSEASTGLFEAVGLVPRIFAWDTTKSRFYLGAHPFERFSAADDLIHKLRNGSYGGHESVLPESIWQGEWRERFEAWLSANGATSAPQGRPGGGRARG